MHAPPHEHEQPKLCVLCSGVRDRKGGRGLCSHCYNVERYWGRLLNHERRWRPRDDVMDDWKLLCGQGYTKRQIAARLGMSFKALERALNRARAAGDPRAVPAVRSQRVSEMQGAA